MGPYEKQVKELIGDEPFSLIRESVRRHEISASKMNAIAFHLHDHVGGKHAQRQESKGQCDDVEIRNILSDWFNEGGMCNMEQSEVLSVLINIFTQVGIQPRYGSYS